MDERTASPEDHKSRAQSGAEAQPSNYFSPKRSQIHYSDRFIPCRNPSAQLSLSLADRPGGAWENLRGLDRDDAAQTYSSALYSELIGSSPTSIGPPDRGQNGTSSPVTSPPRKTLRFMTGDKHSNVAGSRLESPYKTSPITNDGGLGPLSPRTSHRRIPKAPFRVLDAPALQDDFYLNLVDWSSQNLMAVGLGSCVYIWSGATTKVTKLCDLSFEDSSTDSLPTLRESVCSVAWSHRGTYLSIGSSSGYVYIWDIAKTRMVRRMEGHRARVGCLAWNSHILATGGRDRLIMQRDIRAPEDVITTLTGHRSELCGLKWSPDDRELASGGNDNQLNIWNSSSTVPVIRFQEHLAAVKAISWSPHQQGLLASGGGTADRCIRFWNTSTGSQINCVDTGSQVCNLVWSKNVNELVSTHGYSQNQIVVWKYPSMNKITTLVGHNTRVLYLAQSPDGQTVVTGAGDETIRFWNVFPLPKTTNSSQDNTMGSMMRTQIR